jgi:hypothetical protein
MLFSVDSIRVWMVSSRPFNGPTIINCIPKNTTARDITMDIPIKFLNPRNSGLDDRWIVVVEPFKGLLLILNSEALLQTGSIRIVNREMR